MKKNTKPFVRHILVEYGNDITPFAEVLTELGYELYEDPTLTDSSDVAYFISNRPLTYRWLLKNARRYNISRGWVQGTFEMEIEDNDPLAQPNW